MAEKSIANSRYIYIHETGKLPSRIVDVHHVVARSSRVQSVVGCLFALISLYSIVGKIESPYSLFYSIIIGALVIKISRRRVVEKESVVIIPAFGVQLETQYKSGATVRRFVPIDKILKPLLNECVTPVTCYWSLALILRDEDELALVFKELHPPLKMLAPIWKALCAACDSEQSVQTFPDTG